MNYETLEKIIEKYGQKWEDDSPNRPLDFSVLRGHLKKVETIEIDETHTQTVYTFDDELQKYFDLEKLKYIAKKVYKYCKVQDFMKFIQDHPELFEFMNEIKERIEEAIDDTHDE